ncbi:MAG: helix-turn-helix domain-containing protein [Chloroflexi bacterium]|nr:helix-turn-helix domain-containing protein [Chloroflexota bacterium]
MSQFDSDLRLLTIREVAEILRVHPQTVRRWADAGELKYYQFSSKGRRRFMLQDVMAFLNDHVRENKEDSLG